MNRRLAWIGVALSALAIIRATTFASGTSTHGWSFSLASGDAAVGEIIQNLLLFLPLGICLTLAGVRPLIAIPLGAALSFSVEFSQQWIPGRDPSVGDIVCNTASTAFGVALTRTAPRWLFASPARAAWQTLGAAIVAILAWTGTGIALHPVVPAGPFQTIVRPDFNYYSLYQGTVLRARVLYGSLAVRATLPDPPSYRSAPLAALIDAEGHRAIVLSVDRHDLALRYDMLAVRARLEQPDLRWRNALAPPSIAPGDTFNAGTWHDGKTVCLGVNNHSRCNLGYTVGDGWKLIFFPEHFSGWLTDTIDGLWVLGCVFFVGLWAARAASETTAPDRAARRRAATARIAVAMLLIGLIVVPWITGLKGTTLVEWVCALLGIEFGLIVGTRSLQLGVLAS